MTQVLIWAATVPVSGLFAWAAWKWPVMPVRIAAAALFAALWIGALWFANMDVVWRITMPVVMVAAMLVLLVKRSRNHSATTA